MYWLTIWSCWLSGELVVSNPTLSPTVPPKRTPASARCLAVLTWRSNLDLYFRSTSHTAHHQLSTEAEYDKTWQFRKCYCMADYSELSSFFVSCRFHPAMYHSRASHTRLTTSFTRVFSFCHHVISQSEHERYQV